MIGLDLDYAAKRSTGALLTPDATDLYEFLQISPNAQADTIHRV
jgi:hypothetical protein